MSSDSAAVSSPGAPRTTGPGLLSAALSSAHAAETGGGQAQPSAAFCSRPTVPPPGGWPEFRRDVWRPETRSYGLLGLLQARSLVQFPEERPPELLTLKLSKTPEKEGGPARPSRKPKAEAQSGNDRGATREPRPVEARAGGEKVSLRDSRLGEADAQVRSAGSLEVFSPLRRPIPDMEGSSVPLVGSTRGQWWLNISGDRVNVRADISLNSETIRHLVALEYVQQADAVEQVVGGVAPGLLRMQVYPEGWVTLDARALNGQLFFQPVEAPVMQVVYKQNAAGGDVLIREGVEIDTQRCGVLYYGDTVEQTGPTRTLPDGIVRMPIASKGEIGWVTYDATKKEGPKFLEPRYSIVEVNLTYPNEQEAASWQGGGNYYAPQPGGVSYYQGGDLGFGGNDYSSQAGGGPAAFYAPQAQWGAEFNQGGGQGGVFYPQPAAGKGGFYGGWGGGAVFDGRSGDVLPTAKGWTRPRSGP